MRIYWLMAMVLGCSGPPSSLTPQGAGAVPSDAQKKPVDKPPQTGPLSEAALMSDIDWLCAPDTRGRGSYTKDAARVADRVAATFTDLGYEVIRQPVPGGSSNVVAIKRTGQEAVLVSAHYDHLGVNAEGVVFPGADDNASGLAVLLALAKRAAKTKHDHSLIFVAFGAEEPGLIGSGVYMQKPAWPLSNTKAVVNFDMVGRNFFEAGVGREAAVAIVGLEDQESAREAAHAVAKRIGFALVLAPAALVEVFGFENRTDEWWFRRRGIPAIHFSTAMHDDYHRPSDTVDKLKPAQMRGVAQIAWGIIVRLAAISD